MGAGGRHWTGQKPLVFGSLGERAWVDRGQGAGRRGTEREVEGCPGRLGDENLGAQRHVARRILRILSSLHDDLGGLLLAKKRGVAAGLGAKNSRDNGPVCKRLQVGAGHWAIRRQSGTCLR